MNQDNGQRTFAAAMVMAKGTLEGGGEGGRNTLIHEYHTPSCALETIWFCYES